MKELIVPASADELEKVQAFIGEQLDQYGCSMKDKMDIEIAVEELFVNIAYYAYKPEENGTASIRFDASEEPLQIVIQFLDHGVPYNPLQKKDPDITMDADERDIGGLGIFMAKKCMDGIEYSYKDGKNILTIMKKPGGDS